MKDQTPPVWESPTGGAAQQEPAPDATASEETDAWPVGATESGVESDAEAADAGGATIAAASGAPAAAEASARGRAAQAMRRISLGTAAALILGALAIGGLGFVAGRATAPDLSQTRVTAEDTIHDEGASGRGGWSGGEREGGTFRDGQPGAPRGGHAQGGGQRGQGGSSVQP